MVDITVDNYTTILNGGCKPPNITGWPYPVSMFGDLPEHNDTVT